MVLLVGAGWKNTLTCMCPSSYQGVTFNLQAAVMTFTRSVSHFFLQRNSSSAAQRCRSENQLLLVFYTRHNHNSLNMLFMFLKGKALLKCIMIHFFLSTCASKWRGICLSWVDIRGFHCSHCRLCLVAVWLSTNLNLLSADIIPGHHLYTFEYNLFEGTHVALSFSLENWQ